MSRWLEIEDIEDLEVEGDMLNVLYESDDWGNNYIQIPIEMIKKKLEGEG